MRLLVLVAIFELATAQDAGVSMEAFKRMIDYYNQDSNTAMEKMLFSRMKPDVTIDFVVDIHNSPTMDDVDVRVTNNPINSLFFGNSGNADASEVYRSAIGLFIDWVTLDIRPGQTYTTLIDNGQKYYIRGRQVNQTQPDRDVVTLTDSATKARALWPHMTGSDEVWYYNSFFKNRLGYLTKLALAARDNGLPIVLKDKKELTTAFTVVITDGAAKTPAYVYSSEPNKTFVIDIGNRRYAQKLAYSDVTQYAGVVTLDSPQALPLMANTVRYLACAVVSP